MAYLIPYLSLLILSLLDVFNIKISKRVYNSLLTFIILYLILMASIRYGMGVDYNSYFNIVNEVKVLSDHSYLEVGFRAIIVLMKYFVSSPYTILAVFAAVSIFPLRKFLTNYSYTPIFSLFIYFTVFYITYVFNGIRQGIAMSVFLLSLESILSRDIRKVVMFTLIGMSFHYSAVLIIIAYLINVKYVELTRSRLIVILGICLLLSALSPLTSEILINISPGFISKKIVEYNIKYNVNLEYTSIMLRILIISPLVMYYDQLKENTNFRLLFNVYLFGFVIYSGLYSQKVFITRINMFLRILEIVLVPYLFKFNSKKEIKLLLFIYYAILYSVTFIESINSPYYTPFIHIFS